MATSDFKYCSHRDVKDVYPNIDESDSKTVVRNWVSLGNNVYIAHNTGLVTALYQDGKELGVANTLGGYLWGATLDATLDSAADVDTYKYNTISYSSMALGSEGDIKPGAYALMDDSGSGVEYVFIEAIDTGTNKITVRRGALGSTPSLWNTSASSTIQNYIEVSEATQWYYDSYFDQCLFYSTTDPNELLMEAGEDWATLIDRMIVNCSMELSAMLDARFPRPIPKSFQYAEATDGSDTPEYDYILKRLTALLVAHHLLVSKDPNSEEALALKEESEEILNKINNGDIKLSFEVDAADHKGSITEVTRTGTMYLVETVGSWTGAPYDRVKIKCSVAGVYGTCKVDIYALGGNNLYGAQLFDDLIVTGGLQEVHGIWFRFQGNSMAEDDEWHIEVRNYAMNTTNSGVRSIKATHSWRVGRRIGEE